MVQATRQEKFQVFAESKSQFFYKVVDARITFVPEKDGKVNKLILHQGCEIWKPCVNSDAERSDHAPGPASQRLHCPPPCRGLRVCLRPEDPAALGRRSCALRREEAVMTRVGSYAKHRRWLSPVAAVLLASCAMASTV